MVNKKLEQLRRRLEKRQAKQRTKKKAKQRQRERRVARNEPETLRGKAQATAREAKKLGQTLGLNDFGGDAETRRQRREKLKSAGETAVSAFDKLFNTSEATDGDADPGEPLLGGPRTSARDDREPLFASPGGGQQDNGQQQPQEFGLGQRENTGDDLVFDPLAGGPTDSDDTDDRFMF